MKNESDVKKRVKELLDKMGVWWFMYVPVGYGKSGIPDFICCYDGHFLAIETKYGGNKPTALQNAQMDKITAAGGGAIVVDEHNVDDLDRLVQNACS